MKKLRFFSSLEKNNRSADGLLNLDTDVYMSYCTAAVFSFQGQTVHVHERRLHTVHVHVHSVHERTRKLFSGYSHCLDTLRLRLTVLESSSMIWHFSAQPP
jgi:hypothetical protein